MDKEYIIENLAILVDAGIDIISALRAIQEESNDKHIKKTIEILIEKVDNGSTLWEAMESVHLLPAHAVSLVRAGEASGKLPENLQLIANQNHRDRAFKSKVFSAMMYPMIVLSLTIAIGSGIALFLLPRLAGIFKNLRVELPLITKIFINIGTFLGKNGTVIIPVFLVVLFVGVFFLFIFPKTRFIGFRLLFSIPQIRKLIQEVEIAHTFYILGTLLEAGLPLVEALDSIRTTTTLPFYQKFYIHLRDNIQDGNTFRKSFSSFSGSSKLIPRVLQQMIIAAEQSGNLTEVFLKISKNFEEKTETTTKNLTTLIEPLLLIIIWLGVMSVALAVILPIYSLIGSMNR